MTETRQRQSPKTFPRERVERLVDERGRLPFAEVMEEALYGEGGYYTRQQLAIGPEGDFVTGSSHSALFGRATARLLLRLDEAVGRPADLLEAGCGDGRHLTAVVEALGESLDEEPPGRRSIRGWDRVPRQLPDGVEALGSLDELARPVEGLVFSYELFDALPIHRLVGREDGCAGELWVVRDADGSLGWQPGELSHPELGDLLGAASLEPGQVADLAPGWAPLYRRLARTLGRGLLVTCDYGYERRRLLDPRVRRHGTLAAYRRHRVHRDVLSHLGEQDLTAHVDFTALREAGEAEGLETFAFSRQALWLAALGIFEDLAPEGAGAADLVRRQEAALLLDPEGMGEEIRVLVQGRGLAAEAVSGLDLVG
ncbi:MAG: SAM-dependent methyltransferase [Thermoanaerobaculia bacterium]|nr:SAM-dependent methyltransferase [Thermoanaerobaculia bacterium]